MVSLVHLVERYKVKPVESTSTFVFPDFVGDETQEVRKFMESFFRLRLPDSYYIQLYVIIVVISVLIVWGIAIVSKQLYERRFWILRSQQTSSNIKILIPNSTASFIVFEGVFAVCWFSYIFWSRSIDEGQTDNPKGRAAYMLATWVPLFIGAWGAAWGSFYLCPGLLSMGVKTGRGLDPSRFIPSTFVLNLFSVGFPVLFTGAMSGIAATAEKRWSTAIHLWNALDKELELQVSGPVSELQLAQALEVWKSWSIALWWVSTGFLVFCVVASTLFLFYSGASLILIHKLKDQIIATGTVFPGFRSLTKTSQVNSPAWTSNVSEKEAKAAAEAAEEEKRAAMSTFYPPVKNPEAKMSKAKTSSERAKILQGALVNICIMSLSINIAVLGYVANTGYISGTLYEASLSSPHDVTRVYITYNLVAGWLAAIFGTISFSNIFLNTYSTFFENLAESKLRSRPSRSKDEGVVRSKDLIQMKQKKVIPDQEKPKGSMDTFGRVKMENSEEGLNSTLQEDRAHIYSDSDGRFQTSRCDGTNNRFLSPQKSNGNMSTYSEGFVQRDFLDENFFTLPGFSLNETERPLSQTENAQMESIFEGGGIDSMIGNQEEEMSFSNNRSIDQQRVSQLMIQDNVNGNGVEDQSQDHSLSHSFSIDAPHQRWDSARWTTGQGWDPSKAKGETPSPSSS